MGLPSNSTLRPQFKYCMGPEIMPIMTSLVVVYWLLMPLFICVLVLGYQRWRKDGFSSPFTTWSHIDIFTYCMVVLDLLNILGTTLFFFGSFTEKPGLQKAGSYMFAIYIPGQTMFHLLTCMERYMAVVHPIVYLRLKGPAGIRFRNIAVGCVWLISFFSMCLITVFGISFTITNGLLFSVTSVAFFFCSLSVLCAMIPPGPAKDGKTRERPNQSKQKAFHTIILITGTLSIRFLGSLISTMIQNLDKDNGYFYCLMGWSSIWFMVPSSLVLPLLFLQRVGKLHICKETSGEAA